MFWVAVFFGKTVYLLLKFFGRNATCFPGTVALLFDKDFLKKIKINAKIIAITGTNGKTATSNMIYDFLKNTNYTVINNSFGSNIESGIVSLMLSKIKYGEINLDYIVVEVDERSSVHIFQKIKPDYLVITNIFRDSYSRNAHPEYIINVLNSAIPDDTVLIVNADDLLSCSIKPFNNRIFYSFTKEFSHASNNSNVIDTITCPCCHNVLDVDYRRYHHIGRYHCSNCGFKSIDGDYELFDINNYSNEIYIKHDNNIYTFPAISEREIDLYNQLAVITLLHLLKFDFDIIAKEFSKIKIISSRFNKIDLGEIQIVASLAKGLNPVASSRVFDFIIQANKNCSIILVQSETGFITKGDYDDSRNLTSESIGWLYEIDFELLNNSCVKQVIVGGKRILDYKVRCELAGISDDKIIICRNPLNCSDYINFADIEIVYILFDIHNQSFADYNIKKIKERFSHES